MNCLYSGDKAIMKDTIYFNTKKEKKKKNNHNELKSKQNGWLRDDDPICFDNIEHQRKNLYVNFIKHYIYHEFYPILARNF